MSKRVIVLICLLTALTRAAEDPVGRTSVNLATHGPLTTAADAQATLDRAVSDQRASPGGGGLLVIPPSAPGLAR